MLIVCKFKAKERNCKGFAVKFMHTLAFCVLFQKILHHHRETLVNRLSFFAYNLSEREVGCRFGRTAGNAYLRSDGECRGILHFFCARKGALCAVLSRFFTSTAEFSERLADFCRSIVQRRAPPASTSERQDDVFTKL